MGCCAGRSWRVLGRQGTPCPAPFPRLLVLRKFGADFYFVFFFFWLPIFRKTGMCKTLFAMCETFFCADSWFATFCTDYCADFWCADFSSTFWRLTTGIPESRKNQRKTKGQQLKGKIVSALFGTFPHTFTLFQSFSEFFLQDIFLELRGFPTVLV